MTVLICAAALSLSLPELVEGSDSGFDGFDKLSRRSAAAVGQAAGLVPSATAEAQPP